jgi:plastocyanin
VSRVRRLGTTAALVALGGTGGAAIGLLPTIAAGDSGASVTAQDDQFVLSGGGSTVSIAAGSTVSFSYPSGSNEHDVHFTTMPSVCSGSTAQLGPTAAGGVGPAVGGPGWQGACTFNTAGTYNFFCDRHGYAAPGGGVGGMSGTIDVTGSSTGTTTTTPAGSTPPTGTSAVLAALKALSAARSQHGTSVSETFTSPAAALKVTVELIGSNHKTLGKLTRTTSGAGALRLQVALSASGRSALHRAHHLTLKVHTVVSGSGITAHSANRTVTLRA